jgi:flagellar assembly protein FliH
MSSTVIPKERLSAYERWELAALDAGHSPHGIEHDVVSAPPTLDQLRKLREQAHSEGYADGFEQGRLAGLGEGRQQCCVLAEQLASLAREFSIELSRADERLAEEVLDLALDVAKAVLKKGLETRADLVIPVVREALRYLPAVQQPAMLFLHPDDAAHVKECLQDDLAQADWRIVEDPNIQRGGCRVETASNQIDASIGTRWQRIARALGKSSEWLN